VIACEVARRWEEQRANEDLVTAVLDRNIPRALALADDDRIKRLSDREPATHLTILSVLGGSGEPELLNRVEARVRTEPGLVTERFGGGRTLLHEAAGQWAPAFARLLLSLGADPNAEDEFGHAPLYCAGNHFLRRGSTSETDAAELVRVLAEAGANVNHAGGSKACTPLHMAARQGHVALAEALLDRGADREACDSVGDTPLRRAVNCGKVPMAAFLLQRGADPNSRGSRKLTPVQAARGKQMRELFDR
jgi:ankyrin repeat protein